MNHLEESASGRESAAARKLIEDLRLDPSEVMSNLNVGSADAAVLLVGSLNEGLAAPGSDIDFLVVYPPNHQVKDCGVDALARKFPFSEEDAIFPQVNTIVVNRRIGSRHLLQIEITDAAAIRNLQDNVSARMNSVYARIQNKIGAKRRQGAALQPHDQVLIHRLNTGMVVKGDDLIGALRNRLSLEEFSQYLVIMRVYAVRSYVSDLEMFLETEDAVDTAAQVYLHRRVIAGMASALLAGVGQTNAKEKFIFRLLSRHANAIGQDLVEELRHGFMASFRNHSELTANLSVLVRNTFKRIYELCPMVGLEEEASTREGILSGILNIDNLDVRVTSGLNSRLPT
jgi:hypothetical protein